MARLRTKDLHLLPGVRIISGRYYYQSTRVDAGGKRIFRPLGKVGEEDVMRREWARIHILPVKTLGQHPITIDGPMVYFVRVGRAVKIGFSSSKRRFERRLLAFKVSSAKPIKVIGAVQGDRQSEKSAHRALASHSLSGEWFSMKEPVISYINHALLLGRIPRDL